jgi:hypothetical protein
LESSDIVAAWVAAQPKGRATRFAIARKLAAVIPVPEACAEAERRGLIEVREETLVAVPAAEAGNVAKSAPRHSPLRDLAALALGASLSSKPASRDLPALALRQLFQLDELPAWPSALHVRCALLARIAQSLAEGLVVEAARRDFAKGFRFDPMSRSFYLAFAGLERGSVVQADAALLSSALGGPAGTVEALTATVLRAAIAAKKAELAPPPQSEEALEAFALSVRRLAGRLETKPFAGRVAIAQVYDAGLAAGLSFGSLEDFKTRVAEAAREGFLDLERYDIAGPLDPDLKERSRLRLGRDERHFIVNQWI